MHQAGGTVVKVEGDCGCAVETEAKAETPKTEH